MTHPERLWEYLGDIDEAMGEALAFLTDCASVAAFEHDRLRQHAVIRLLTLIGEAAGRMQTLAPAFVTAHPEIPWDLRRGMCNRMVHDDAHVGLAMVFRTVKQDFPPLQAQLCPLLA